MLEIGKTYYRHDPGNRKTRVEIQTERELRYYQSLEDDGYVFEVLEAENLEEANQQ